MKLKNYIAVMFLTFTGIARADVLADIKAQNPKFSPFQVLEQLYLTAHVPADFSYFDTWGTTSNMKCALADKSTHLPYAGIVLQQYEIAIGGTPGRGPLFPGTPGAIKKFLVPSGWSSPTNSVLQTLAVSEVFKRTPTELTLTVASEPDLDPYDFPLSMSFRKNGTYIVSKIASGSFSLKYQYCWRE